MMGVLASVDVTVEWYLILGAGLFALGMFGMLTRRNPLVMFMCVELMLNAVNLTFVAMAKSSTTWAARSRCSSCWWWRRPKSLSASRSSCRSCAGVLMPAPTMCRC